MEQDIVTQIGELKSSLLAKIGDTPTRAEMRALQVQVDAIDRNSQGRIVGGSGGSGVARMKSLLENNSSVMQMLENKRGSALIRLTGEDTRLLEAKTVILSSGVGYQTTGVLEIGRLPGITTEARQRLTVRGLLTATPTQQALVDFVAVNTPLSIASPQTEGSDKAQNTVTFTSKSEKVQTLATWIPASRQIMDDMQELASFLQSGLLYYTNLSEELQLLVGSGTGTDLNGLVTQSTPLNSALLGSSYTRIDIIGHAIEQLSIAKEIQPTFCVLHPSDWMKMRLLKDTLGRYILGDPQSVVPPSLFGLSVVPTVSIANGTFLVGSGDPEAAEIRDRLEAIVEISSEHSDYFVKNLLAVRCEKRLALVVRRPASFIRGSFTTSP